jgi:hypothetical protein
LRAQRSIADIIAAALGRDHAVGLRIAHSADSRKS